MAYEVYLDDMLLPIPPQKIPIKYPGQNQTASLIDGTEINLTRKPGLAEISLDIVFPQMDYPAAVWDGSVDSGEEFVERLRELHQAGRPFEFMVIRDGPGKLSFFDTNLNVTLEEYTVSDAVSEGFDLAVSMTLKEYRNYGTKVLNFVIDGAGTASGDGAADGSGGTNGNEGSDGAEAAAEVTETGADRMGEPRIPESYTVQKGDSLWKIAKKVLGNGDKWQEIYQKNRDKISNPNRIVPGQVLTLPTGEEGG